MTKTSDIKHLLHQATDGFEEAKALLRPANFARTQFMPPRNTSCDTMETLAELCDGGALSSPQEQQFFALQRRVEKLRPQPVQHAIIEPRLNWPVEDGAQ